MLKNVTSVIIMISIHEKISISPVSKFIKLVREAEKLFNKKIQSKICGNKSDLRRGNSINKLISEDLLREAFKNFEYFEFSCKDL